MFALIIPILYVSVIEFTNKSKHANPIDFDGCQKIIIQKYPGRHIVTLLKIVLNVSEKKINICAKYNRYSGLYSLLCQNIKYEQILSPNPLSKSFVYLRFWWGRKNFASEMLYNPSVCSWDIKFHTVELEPILLPLIILQRGVDWSLWIPSTNSESYWTEIV